MKNPNGYVRTIRNKRAYVGHDFTETELCLTKHGEKYYLELWDDPFPGGYGQESCVQQLEIPAELAHASNDELLSHYNSHAKYRFR